jgi:RNA polymerase sigma-70 factor (ECF subfamily)
MAVQPATLSLVQAAKQGDDSAFEALLEPMLQQAYRLAFVMLHDHHAAEDSVQDAALKAWRKVSQLREGAEMRPWFLAIVANQCRSTRRSRWWAVLRTEALEVGLDPGDDAVLEGVELRRAMRGMGPDKRLVLVLHWYLDLPVNEIAGVIGTSTHAAESRLSRATRELKKRMEAHRGRP